MSDILGDRRRATWLLALLMATASLSASAGAGCRECARPQADSPVASAAAVRPPAPATLTVNPPAAAQDVSPAVPVFVRASAGTLTEVQMTNEGGRVIAGTMTPDHRMWRPAEELGYGRTYTLTVRSRGVGGMSAAQTSTFSTVSPADQTSVELTATSGQALADGATYGVGTVVVARFDEQIGDRAAAERRLVVTTDPPVTGSWYWVDDQTAHWRPERYFAPGTKVTVAANVYGARLGDGLYGQDDRQVSFRIGDAHVSIADDTTKQVSVYDNGVLVRTMPTSMGMGGTETIGGTTLSFWTPPGVYTVLDKDNPVIMDSSTFGLPTNSRLGYRETISYATPHQHRRHLPAPVGLHGVGAGQHQPLARLPEPQRRERQVVLRLLGPRRRGRGPQHRRPPPHPRPERRLDDPLAGMAQGQRPAVSPQAALVTRYTS